MHLIPCVPHGSYTLIVRDAIVCSDTLVSLVVVRLSKKQGDKAKKSKQVSQKYTASRLHEKGVLISIEDLQPNQWVELKPQLRIGFY